MEEQHQRTIRVSSVDEDGTFVMTLATEGEASDGDILNIAGGQIPERMPLLLSHWNDPTAIAGSVTDPVKRLKESPPKLDATGHIEMGGQGSLAEVRRDVAYMMNRHGGSVSIRWDAVPGKPPVRRVNLPSDHPYYVNAEEAKGPERWGLYWDEWKALEGSIVTLGADPLATVHAYRSRAEETDGEVREFWQRMAQDAAHEEEPEPLKPPEPTIELDESEEGRYKRIEFPTADESTEAEAGAPAGETAEEPATPSDEERAAALVASLRSEAAACLEAGISVEELLEAVTDSQRKPDEPVQIVEALAGIASKLEALEARFAERESVEALEVGQEPDDSPTSTEDEHGREDPGEPPAPPMLRAHEFIDQVVEQLRAAHPVSERKPDPYAVDPAEVAELLERQLQEEEAQAAEADGREKESAPPALRPDEFIDAVIGQLRAAHAPPEETQNPHVMRPSEVAALLEGGLDAAWERVQEMKRAAEKKARGEVTT